MTTPALPFAVEELSRRLSVSLGGPGAGPLLIVANPGLVHSADGLGLRVDVTAGAERWRVTIPVDPIDLAPDVSAAVLVTVLRANLEEWWHCKDHERHVAAWGLRLP